MNAGIKDFVGEQTKGLAERTEHVRKTRVAAARRAAVKSAERVRSLNERVRKLARSGVKLTVISQDAAQSLIELQAEIVTSALTDAASQLQRIAQTQNVQDLVRGQAGVLQATRERIVEDMSRAVKILKGAAGDVRKVAEHLAAEPVKARKTAGRKPKARARKTARRAAA
jgi:phasin family protein